MRLEITLNTSKDWNAHKRRDLIEDFTQHLALETPNILAKLLYNFPNSEISSYLEENKEYAKTVETLFKISFPFSGHDNVKIQINRIIPPNFGDNYIEKHKREAEEVNKHWAVKATNWLISKISDDEIVQKIEEDIKKRDEEKMSKAIKDAWSSKIIPVFLITMGTWLKKNGYEFNDTLIHHENGSARIIMDIPVQENGEIGDIKIETQALVDDNSKNNKRAFK